MENIKLSFIIPTYNSEDFIEDCLNSIFSQTYKNYEIIVIDDCSTDETLNILKKYNNIKILSTPKNSRQGAARNIGLNNCTGDYVLFVDADDSLYSNDVLEKLTNEITKKVYPDIIYLGFKMVGNRDLLLMPDKVNSTKKYRLSENPFINVFSVCWKNELLQKNDIRFPENIRYEDVYFAFLGIEKAQTYSYTDFIYYKYNNRASSTTTTYTLDQSMDTIKLINELINLYDKIDEKNFPYLESRIKQQVDRASVRLNRAIDFQINLKSNIKRAN